MKILGIILIVIGALNLIVAMIAASQGYGEQVSGNLGGGIGFIVLGLFLKSRADEKERERQEKENWKNEK